MATATQFFQYWALAFGTLCVALVLLSIFYRFIDCDLGLHGLRKEAVIAGIASAVQGAGFWFSASLFHGQPFRRLVIPTAIVAIIYWLSHLEDWSGYEIGGITFFQAAILSTGLCVIGGQFTLAAIIAGAFAFGLVIIAGVARSL
jgi:hypothetical protein